ncbi:MAG: MFS transporter [Candidatus Hydrogenedentota bacterium]|nr:MAG: MFS transporter [Candidatus Hydrogenedentota bacterium]
MNDQPRISTAKIVIYSVGAIGTGFFWAFYGASLPLFLSDFTDSKLVISIPISLGGVLACTLPPLVGYLSDRTHTRFGRRRPYIFLGAICLYLSMVGLPHLASLGGVIVVSTLLSLFAYTAETPYVVLLPDITPPEQRGTASGVMHFAFYGAMLVYFIMGTEIWENHPTETFYIVAIIWLGALSFAMALIREPRAAVQEQTTKQVGTLAHLSEILKATEAMKFLVSIFFLTFGPTMVWAFITLFAVQELGVSEGDSLWIFFANAAVTTLFAIPLGIWGDRIDKKRLLMWMCVSLTVLTFLLAFPRNYSQAVILYGLAGIPTAAALVVGYAFFLDLVPEERVGEFVGINMITWAAPQAIAPAIGGYLIDAWGYRSMFPAAAGFMVIGLIIFPFIRVAASQDDMT